ncbi:alanine dehydrogenase [Candidatus Gracilibacteria bacterium]|nr:alanine dehydrogenase [Candidatus Gracilibacteria bacterium]
MIIATLKEVKDNENRVGLTPDGVRRLVKAGHTVIVERQAGYGSGFSDEMYQKAGAKLNDSPHEIVKKADMIVKIKEPVVAEYYWLDLFKGKTLFTYLHLSGVDPKLTEKLLENNITGIAYETVFDGKGLPLLKPMSQVAGVLACQYGANYMQKMHGGTGNTLGHIDGAEPALTVVVGAGIVGKTAAMTAGGMGGKVVLLDINKKVLDRAKKEITTKLGTKLSKNVKCEVSNTAILSKWVKQADLLIGGVLIPGKKAPTVVSEKMIKSMKKGAVVVDVSIDQGGCIWGSKPTTHRNPIFDFEGKVFCCITNMPGQVAHQSTQALTSATLPYILKMGKIGVLEALKRDKSLRTGLNTFRGKITYANVANDLGKTSIYESAEKMLKGA